VTERTHNLAGVDIADLPAIRATVEQAKEIGHWRRIFAVYADHLPACPARNYGASCECGFATAMD
jgi:hypothetical protein